MQRSDAEKQPLLETDDNTLYSGSEPDITANTNNCK